MATSVIQTANARLMFYTERGKLFLIVNQKDLSDVLVMFLIQCHLTMHALFGILAYLRF